MPDLLRTNWATPDNLTDEQIAEGGRAFEDLIKVMARASARASHRLGIRFDMDDPEVARDVIKATFDGLFYSRPSEKKRNGKDPIPT
jgi:hypothetical protein